MSEFVLTKTIGQRNPYDEVGRGGISDAAVEGDEMGNLTDLTDSESSILWEIISFMTSEHTLDHITYLFFKSIMNTDFFLNMLTSHVTG